MNYNCFGDKQMNNIWDIAKKYNACWISKAYGYLELVYEKQEQKLLAEKEFLENGFTILQGTSNYSEAEFNRKVHRIFSCI